MPFIGVSLFVMVSEGLKIKENLKNALENYQG